MSTNTQPITGVDFVALPTHDVEKAAAFYGDTLGLRRSVYMPDRHFAEFETGNLTLLEERGVKFRGETLDTSVCHMAFFNDPDGNALMLHHRYAPRVTEG
jgi:extradiol dioxygenase family protein